jgi:hypothetical protein
MRLSASFIARVSLDQLSVAYVAIMHRSRIYGGFDL